MRKLKSLTLKKFEVKDEDNKEIKRPDTINEFMFMFFGHWTEQKVEHSRFRRTVKSNIDNDIYYNKILQYVAYRGSGKSAMVSDLLPIWRIVNKMSQYTLLFGATQNSANENLSRVVGELVGNEWLRKTYNIRYIDSQIKSAIIHFGRGERFVGVNNVENSIALFHRKTYSCREIYNKIYHMKPNKMSDRDFYRLIRAVKIKMRDEPFTMKIRAVSLDGAYRGTRYLNARPRDIFCDDLLTDQMTKNIEQRDKTFNLFTNSLMKLPSRTEPSNIFIVGTRLHQDDLLARITYYYKPKEYVYPLVLRFPDNMELWKTYVGLSGDEQKSYFKRNRKAMVKGFRSDNPLIPIEDIIPDYIRNPISFNQEMQNEIALKNSESEFSDYELYSDLPQQDFYYFLGLDPAFSVKGDNFGFTIIARPINTPTKHYVVFSRGFKGLSPQRAIQKIYELNEKYEFRQIVLEKNHSPIFKNWLDNEQPKYNTVLPIKSIWNKEKKEVRLSRLSLAFETRSVVISNTETQLIGEIRDYGTGSHDDILDSCEMAYSSSKGYRLETPTNKQKIKERSIGIRSPRRMEF
jgi:hypothetical protein